MNPAMKQRIVGTVVLGCLAIILVPLLLDGDGITGSPLSANIPPAPKLDASAIKEPARPVITADSQPAPGQEPADATTVQDAVKTVDSGVGSAGAVTKGADLPAYDKDTQEIASKAPAASQQADALEAAVASIMAKGKQGGVASADNTPKLDSSGLPQTFVIRLGSFAERKNAESLVAKLVSAGYKAFSRQTTTANGPMQVVLVGPFVTRVEAVTLQTRLENSNLGKGVVETFVNPPLK